MIFLEELINNTYSYPFGESPFNPYSEGVSNMGKKSTKSVASPEASNRQKKSNTNLHSSKSIKNDEFYTELSDIENELKHYKNYFKNKIVFCNCDDPEWSNFWKYFSLNFDSLNLKKLISTHFEKDGKPSYKLELFKNDLGELTVLKTPLIGNGDFKSDECVSLLKESDIVVTNPPFSLFREYLDQLISHNKKFLIIGNTNAITYKEVFKQIKNNKVWIGVSPRSMSFKMPDGEMKQVNACWFTNLSHKKRAEKIILFQKYINNENNYPKYENYDAIEVSKVSNIPEDYLGIMGVPITFLEKYNPEQFEIVGLGISNSGISIGVKPYKAEHKKYRKEVQKRGAVDGDLYMMVNGEVEVPYARILIKIIKEKEKK